MTMFTVYWIDDSDGEEHSATYPTFAAADEASDAIEDVGMYASIVRAHDGVETRIPRKVS
jgi:hypothetical protein